MPLVKIESTDAVFVDPSLVTADKTQYTVKLTIGPKGQRGSRYTLLTAKATRLLAYALLDAAERNAQDA